MAERQKLTKLDIPELLHDATLQAIEFDESLNTARISFSCLRANSSKSEVSDQTIEIRITNIKRIAAYYDAASFEEQYSDPPVAELLTLQKIRDLQFDDLQCETSVDSLDELLVLCTSGRIDWLLGNAIEEEHPLISNSIFITMDTSHYRPGAVRRSLFIEGTAIDQWSAGLPLSLEDWGDQYSAWWSNWETHWKNKDEKRLNEGPTEEDTFIPCGEDAPPDLGFHPPNEPAFDLGSPHEPEELLSVIKDYHEGILTRNWQCVAMAWPNFDFSITEKAKELEASFLGFNFGRWIYIRHLDKYWIEGPRACLVLRGVEYTAPMEGDPAEAQETVISYSLRRMRGRWVIRAFSQGWPNYGSAPKSGKPTPWLTKWEDLI